LRGLAPLLHRLAEDIRRELRREPDAGDLLLVLACLSDGLPGQAIAALSVDLDALWGAIEQVRIQAASQKEEIRREIEGMRRSKERAIEASQFDGAAELRDQERQLRERALAQTRVQIDEALDAVRQRLGISRLHDEPRPDADDT